MNRTTYYTYDLLLLNGRAHPGYGGGTTAADLAELLLKEAKFLKQEDLVRKEWVDEGFLLAFKGYGLLIRDTTGIGAQGSDDQAWGHLVRVFWRSLDLIGNMREEAVDFFKRIAAVTSIRVTADDVSDYAIEELAPLISRLENGLRRALVKYYSMQLGLGKVSEKFDPYISRLIRNRTEEKIKTARRNDDDLMARFWSHLESDIREMGFEDLGSLVFSPTTASRYLEATLIKMVRSADREERIRHWNVFMNDHSIALHTMMDTAGFRSLWYQMNGIRNLVAHNSLTGLAQIEEGRKLYMQLMDRILAFEQQLVPLNWPIDEDRFRESLDNYMAAVAEKEAPPETISTPPSPIQSQSGISYFSNLLQLTAPTMIGKIVLPKERRGVQKMRKDALNTAAHQIMSSKEKQTIWGINDERDIDDDTWIKWLRDDLEYAQKEHGHHDMAQSRFVKNISLEMRGISQEVTMTALRRLESLKKIERYTIQINGFPTQCLRVLAAKKAKSVK